MLRLVMKFGGTSVGSVERINEVANIVKNEVVQGKRSSSSAFCNGWRN